MTKSDVRLARAEDVAGFEALLEVTPLCPAAMLAPLIVPYLEGKEDQLWFCAEDEGQITALCFAEVEAMTEGTRNMRALAVHPAHRRHGVARV